VFACKDCHFLSSKNKLSTPRLQSSWNSIAILGPLFSIFHCQVSDNVSVAHFIDFLCGLRETESYSKEPAAATVLPNLVVVKESAFAGYSPKKNRCDSHSQSEDPNPTIGPDAPGIAAKRFAQLCSRDFRL